MAGDMCVCDKKSTQNLKKNLKAKKITKNFVLYLLDFSGIPRLHDTLSQSISQKLIPYFRCSGNSVTVRTKCPYRERPFCPVCDKTVYQINELSSAWWFKNLSFDFSSLNHTEKIKNKINKHGKQRHHRLLGWLTAPWLAVGLLLSLFHVQVKFTILFFSDFKLWKLLLQKKPSSFFKNNFLCKNSSWNMNFLD